MNFLKHNLLPRLQRLSRFFRDMVGYRKSVAMLSSSLALTVLELGGFALLFPFIKLVTDDAFAVKTSAKLAQWQVLAAADTHQSIVLVAGAALVMFFLAKALVYSALVKYQARVAAEVNIRSTQRLIDAALGSRYQLFLDEGGVKIAGIGYSNAVHASLLFQCVVAALNEIIFLAIVLISTLFFEPLVVLWLLVLGAMLAVGVFIPISLQVAGLGHSTRDLDVARHRFIYAMTSAIRDIKIMGLEKAFSRRNNKIVQQHVHLFVQYQSLSSALRVVIEAILMCSIVVACIWLAFSSVDLIQLAPVLATVGLIAVRAAPALSRLAGNYNSFRFSLPIVEALLDMYDTIARYPQSRDYRPVAIEGLYAAHNLCFSYKDKQVLHDVSIEIAHGHVIAIVGPSGSGKSTLLDLLAGLQQPSNGKFTLNDIDFDPFHSADFSRSIGYVSQSIALIDATLEFNICLEDTPNPARLYSAIRKANLEGLLDSLPQGLQTAMGEGGIGLSGGQRQRIGIARALYREPALLILDEITSALDEATARAIMREIHDLRGQTSILIVSHDMSLVQADRTYHISDGRLIELVQTS